MYAMKSIPGSIIALLPVFWISLSHCAGMEIMGGTVKEFAAVLIVLRAPNLRLRATTE